MYLYDKYQEWKDKIRKGKDIYKLLISHLKENNLDVLLEADNLKLQLSYLKKHADITTLKPATGYLRKKQIDLLKFAEEFFGDIKELNICPFLIGGNLIGAIRHKGYVPWDDDLDFGLMREDYEKLIAYCKEKYIVEVYTGNWLGYTSEIHTGRMDKAVSQHPNQYILDIWIDQIQITRGTSCVDRMAIDFWAFDYFKDDYSFESHKLYLQELQKRKIEINQIDKIIEFLNNERVNNTNICSEDTENIYFGIDNVGAYDKLNMNNRWIRKNTLLPLRKMDFENVQFWAPNDPLEFMKDDYPDFMEFPKEFGLSPHEGYQNEYMIKNLPTVEFYLVDAFEIYHFLPFYYVFEKSGIYSRFVAEPVESNTSHSWFDYDNAVMILDQLGVRYSGKCNENCDYVFTTQDAIILKKYKGKKIHLPYGFALIQNGYFDSERAIKGFDIKLVHGDYSYDLLKEKNLKPLLVKIGYPKWIASYNMIPYHESEEEDNYQNLVKMQTKPVLVYFPTWGERASIKTYAHTITKLKETFFVVTKAHHCTFRLESEKENLELLYKISDLVLEGNYDFRKAALMGNIALCDVISGAAAEVPLLNRNVKLVLVAPSQKENIVLRDFVLDFAYYAKDSETLYKILCDNVYEDVHRAFRNKKLTEIYGNLQEEELNELVSLIKSKEK